MSGIRNKIYNIKGVRAMKCGIVILNYNDYDMTSNLLNIIHSFDSLDKIVVVDNHSTDDSYKKILEYESDKVVVIRALENGGYSKGNNLGIRYLINNTDVDIIGIANSDVEFNDDFVEKIKKRFEKRNNYSIISGLQVDANGNVGSHPFWPEYTILQYFQMKFFSSRLVDHLLKPKAYHNYVMQKLESKKDFFRVGAVEGSLFFIRKSDLQTIGLLDENVFMYCEEDILAKKIDKIGQKIGVDSSICYLHYGSVTTQKTLSSKVKINHIFNSSVYYFNNYQSNKKILQILNWGLCYLLRLEGTILLNIKG